MNANQKLAEQNRKLAAAKAVTEASNRELEAFSYSVAHDLRAPLRSVDGFCEILEEEYASWLDDTGRGYLERVRRAAQHMATLIDDLLRLASITQGELSRCNVNLSAIACQIADGLRDSDPERAAEFLIAPGIVANGNPRLLRIVLENLLSNAWKFTSTKPATRIVFGSEKVGGETIVSVRDNGVGFDMNYAGKLFGAFQRLHDARDFPGTGIGLATVQRIVNKHGGRIWAEATPGKGATFRFVL
jgi:signal transduction histidine kinase